MVVCFVLFVFAAVAVAAAAAKGREVFFLFFWVLSEGGAGSCFCIRHSTCACLLAAGPDGFVRAVRFRRVCFCLEWCVPASSCSLGLIMLSIFALAGLFC